MKITEQINSYIECFIRDCFFKPDVILVNTDDYTEFCNELNKKMQYEIEKGLISSYSNRAFVIYMGVLIIPVNNYKTSRFMPLLALE